MQPLLTRATGPMAQGGAGDQLSPESGGGAVSLAMDARTPQVSMVTNKRRVGLDLLVT